MVLIIGRRNGAISMAMARVVERPSALVRGGAARRRDAACNYHVASGGAWAWWESIKKRT